MITRTKNGGLISGPSAYEANKSGAGNLYKTFGISMRKYMEVISNRSKSPVTVLSAYDGISE